MVAGAVKPVTPRLVAPATTFRVSFLGALEEYHAEGRHLELPADRLADPDEFARYVAALRADVDHPGEPSRYVADLAGVPPETWPDGYVPQSTYWWVAGEEYLGRVALRHRLTPHLLFEGGHIGFEVRPSARRRGHAAAMLAAALPLAAALGVNPARLDCDAANAASRRVIEKSGGVRDEAQNGTLYFWVSTT
ncbi:MAG: GNAT family N-acetyltransferase [Actinobacteria bacterium]|nr:GNAT family N-acetyltransferase [Actinomycetota bacterium]